MKKHSSFRSSFINGCLVFLLVIILIVVLGILQAKTFPSQESSLIFPVSPTPSVFVTPSFTPTPTPLSFEDMNRLYGPCARVPVLMYHHVENLDQAKADGHAALTVGDTFFQSQMQYIADRGYTVITMLQLIDFFNTGVALPARPLLLTFDDAYDDFYTTAFPILKSFGYHATVFVPTGLIENPGYLTWDQIRDIQAVGLVLFSNHTWSHKNLTGARDVVEREITTAELQLTERGLNSPKVLAYPYGFNNQTSISVLQQFGYELAFTTKSGSTLCKQKRLDLPRVRIGNGNLSAYGI